MGYGKMDPPEYNARHQQGATAWYRTFDLQNVKVAPMNEFSTHHLDQSRQDNARRQS